MPQIKQPFHLLAKHFTKRNSVKDLTVGNPLKLIFVFSIPLLIGNLFQQMYNLVDTIIVGRLLGTNALAAVGNTGSMNFFVLGFVLGLSSGFAVITAQRVGAKDTDGIKKSIAINIILNVLSAIIFTTLSLLLTKPILRAINTPDVIFNDSVTYISILFIGIGAMILYNGAACILRALGDSSSPLYFLIISSILNIILDFVMIIYGKMGVAGAAWATVISQGFSGILATIHLIRKFPEYRLSKSDFSTSLWFILAHLKIGLPMAFQFSITAIGVIILQAALNILGSVTIAAYTAAQKIESMVAIAAGTFGVTMANYTGQNLGAKDIDRIKKGTTCGSILTIAFSIISAAIALIFSEQLGNLFINKDAQGYSQVMKEIKQYLLFTCPFYPPLFMIFIYRNVLQSMGKGFMPLMAGVFELVSRTIIAFTLPRFIGFAGICIAQPAAWLAAAIPLGIAYFSIIKKMKLSK